MRKILILFVVALIGFASCADSKQSMTVTVTNSLALERAGEMVEVPMSDVVAKLKLADTAQIVVLDVDGQQVPYQVTYDEKVVFPVTVGGNSVVTYTIQPGTPAPFDVIACGIHTVCLGQRLACHRIGDARFRKSGIQLCL